MDSELGKHLEVSLTETCSSLGVTLQEIGWENANGEFIVRPRVVFPDNAMVLLGVQIDPRHGTPEEVERWITKTLTSEIVNAHSHWKDTRDEIERNKTIAMKRGNPDLAMPIIGYRQWKIDRDGGLNPIGAGNAGPWSRPDNEGWVHAVCNNGGHRAPGVACHCGFNAYRSMDPVLRSAWPNVAGIILAKGVIEVHDTHPAGFRCEYAKILCLMPMSFADRDRVEWVGQQNRIKVMAPDDAVAYAKEHGILLDDEETKEPPNPFDLKGLE